MLIQITLVCGASVSGEADCAGDNLSAALTSLNTALEAKKGFIYVLSRDGRGYVINKRNILYICRGTG